MYINDLSDNVTCGIKLFADYANFTLSLIILLILFFYKRIQTWSMINPTSSF